MLPYTTPPPSLLQLRKVLLRQSLHSTVGQQVHAPPPNDMLKMMAMAMVMVMVMVMVIGMMTKWLQWCLRARTQTQAQVSALDAVRRACVCPACA